MALTSAPAACEATGAFSAGQAASISVFDVPAVVDMQQTARALYEAGDAEAAEALLTGLTRRYPEVSAFHYNLAALFAHMDRPAEALDSLGRAVGLGLAGSALTFENPAFDSLRDDPRFRELATTVKSTLPEPETRIPIRATKVANGIAMVSAVNTVWDPRFRVLRSLFDVPAGERGPVLADDRGPVAARLNLWYGRRTAAGNDGDLYDNRDGGHSDLRLKRFPQVTRIRYADAARTAGLDRGINTTILFNAITIGNASLAETGNRFWRSLPRHALTQPAQTTALFHQYAANHIYVYPEHRDHDPKHGDLFPANTPYVLISQGSSGSDRPLVQTVFQILAAFRPEVKAFLADNGLIAPTVQWIFRMGQRGIATDEDYLSGRAHPSVFDPAARDVIDMIKIAHDLDVADVPPMVRLRVKEESRGQVGRDVLLPTDGEVLFDTPSAIARVIRSTAYEKRLVVDAGETADPNDRPLRFRWVVLRGDADRIAIRPLNETGSIAEIVVPWHERRPLPWQPAIVSDRVDIGVFADNGVHWSAPAFVSLFYPGNEKRRYRPGGAIAEVDYTDPAYRQRYVDPALFPARNWRDTYRYDDAGNPAGWDRVRDGTTTRFTADGLRVVESDAFGRPLKAEKVAYRVRRKADTGAEVIEAGTGVIVTYAYANDLDLTGERIETPTD